MIVGAVLAAGAALAWVALFAFVRPAGGARGGAARALAAFAEQSLELDSIERVLAAAADTARQQFGAPRAVAFVHAVTSDGWDAYAEGQEPTAVPVALSGVFGWFRHNPVVAARGDLGAARFGAMRGPLAQLMDAYGVDLVVPLVHRGHLLAALGLALGRRPNVAERAALDDFRLLATAACANVRLHREASHVISLAREVDLAAAVQAALVPPQSEGAHGDVTWAGYFRAAGEAGSDFWSVYPVGARTLVVIGDATGAGLAGSMVSAVVKSCCDAIVEAHGDQVEPASLLGALNRALWRPDKPAHMTAFAALIDPRERTARYANAGHPFPYRVGTQGTLSVFHGAGPVLGDELQSRYPTQEMALVPGDLVVFYTDGLVDVRGEDGKPFGDRRLQKLLATSAEMSARGLRDRIVSDVDRLARAGGVEDDLALVVVRFGG